MDFETDEPGEQRRADIGAALANAGDRVQEILDAAERAAGKIQADAERAAEKYLDERRHEADRIVEGHIDDLAEITRGLKARLEGVQHESLALLAEVETTLARIVRVPSGDGPSETGTLRSVPEDRSGVPEQPVAFPGTRAAKQIPDEVLLRATQMAVAGSERTEIERMLRVEFGIQDPIAVVDEMLRSERA